MDGLKTGEKSVECCGATIELFAVTQLAETAEVLAFHSKVAAVRDLSIENKVELPQLLGDGCSLADFAVGTIDAYADIRRWNDVFSDQRGGGNRGASCEKGTGDRVIGRLAAGRQYLRRSSNHYGNYGNHHVGSNLSSM